MWASSETITQGYDLSVNVQGSCICGFTTVPALHRPLETSLGIARWKRHNTILWYLFYCTSSCKTVPRLTCQKPCWTYQWSKGESWGCDIDHWITCQQPSWKPQSFVHSSSIWKTIGFLQQHPKNNHSPTSPFDKNNAFINTENQWHLSGYSGKYKSR